MDMIDVLSARLDQFIAEYEAAKTIVPHPWQFPWHDSRMTPYIFWMKVSGDNQDEILKSLDLPDGWQFFKRQLNAVLSLESRSPEPYCRWYYRNNSTYYRSKDNKMNAIGLEIYLIIRPDAERVEGVELAKHKIEKS